ncbi:IS3 family transposase [Streptomyces jumonjinensis]|uniref:IS3 family transposase n=1 Tax=Streptomyces jumonjinensis TaxID=1945 RepID=UPI00379410F3
MGDSYDNALAENLWMLIKTECVRGRFFATRVETNLTLSQYIDGFYNTHRIQKRLGYLSPIEFEGSATPTTRRPGKRTSNHANPL